MEIVNFIREKSVKVISELSLKNEYLPGKERAMTLVAVVGKNHLQKVQKACKSMPPEGTRTRFE